MTVWYYDNQTAVSRGTEDEVVSLIFGSLGNCRSLKEKVPVYVFSCTILLVGDPLILLCLISSLEYLVLIGGLW
jgi:hypothetical protein